MFADSSQQTWKEMVAQQAVDAVEELNIEQWSTERRLRSALGAMIEAVVRRIEARERLERSLRLLG
jgi:hypothetical protein